MRWAAAIPVLLVGCDPIPANLGVCLPTTDTGHVTPQDDTGGTVTDTSKDSGDTDTAPIDTSGGFDTDTGGPPQPALEGGVLIYQGEGALPIDSGPDLINGVDSLTSLYESLGATVTVTSIWPDDITPYRLLLWYLPGASEPDGYTIAQARIDDVKRFLWRGGRLVLGGDVDGTYDSYSLTQGNATIDDLLSHLAIDIRINNAFTNDLSCTPGSTNPIMAGATVDAYAGGTLSILGPAEWLACEGVAVQTFGCGDVVVTGDVNMVADHPEEAQQLVENLYTVPVTASCP